MSHSMKGCHETRLVPGLALNSQALFEIAQCCVVVSQVYVELAEVIERQAFPALFPISR